MEKTIDTIVDGGKATAGPPLGPALGPLGVNAGNVIAEINKATAAFAGIKVPVKVIVDTSSKQFRIEVGSPPTAELIKKDAGIEKGSGNKDQKAGNASLQVIIGVAKKKNTLARELKQTTKEVLGTCKSMGLQVDGKDPSEIIKEINKGMHDSLFSA